MVPAQVDVDAIRRQLEYYFSDSNLPRDKFLRAKTEENEFGFVPIAVLLTFRRLQALGATPAHIADAVKSSTLLQLDEHATCLRRVAPLPEHSQFINRAVFAKGWTPGGPEPTIDDFIGLFAPSGNVLSVRIRRWSDESGKHFKGSVFVEMETAEAAERVVAEEYTISIKDKHGTNIDKQLLVMPVDEYFSKKKEENRNRTRKYRLKVDNTRPDSHRNNRPENGVNGDANGSNANTDQHAPEDGPVKDDGVVPDIKAGPLGDERKDRELISGLILKFDGFGPDVSREDIREAFEPHGDVAWVDFRRGDAEGFIRFARPGMAEASREAMVESKTEFGGKVPTFTVLEGEAEELYWKQTWAKKDAAMENNRKRRRDAVRGGGRGGKRFRGPGRGRGGPRGGR